MTFFKTCSETSEFLINDKGVPGYKRYTWLYRLHSCESLSFSEPHHYSSGFLKIWEIKEVMLGYRVNIKLCNIIFIGLISTLC